MRRPIMNDPDQIERLEGRQFVVLRPTRAVSTIYRSVQDAALARVAEPVKHPHTEHVTLRGFDEPDRRAGLADVVRDWARGQRPIEVTAEAVDVFPAPWQIVIVHLARTASLLDAYSRLSDALESTDLQRSEERSLDDWTFHLSVLYGDELSPPAWAALAENEPRPLPSHPTEVIAEAELVWFSGGQEFAEVIPFGLAT